MKTLLLTALAFTSLALFTPTAEARDHSSRDSHHSSHHSYSSGRGDYGRSYDGGGYYRHSYDREDCESRSYYSHHYYSPAPRYYYSDDCQPRRSHRAPLISFLFGF